MPSIPIWLSTRAGRSRSTAILIAWCSRRCLAREIDHLDLADGSDFVKGIAQFDGEARIRGVFALTGASSFPLLTAAVVRRLSKGMSRIDGVSAGIAPSPYAGLGLNVIRSIASCAASRSH